LDKNLRPKNFFSIFSPNHSLFQSSFFKPINYTASEVSLMNGAVGVGLTLATLPTTRLYIRFGAFWPLLIGGLTSALATGLFPMAAEIHLYAAVGLRFLQGVCFSVDFPTVGALCSNWAPLTQTALFIAILTSYSAFATSITDSFGGIVSWLEGI
jgi:MFS family permease